MRLNNMLLLCLMPFLLLTQSTFARPSVKDLESAARRFIVQLQEGEFAEAISKFDSKMKQAVSQEQLSQIWKGLQAQSGAFEKAGAARVGQSGPYQTVDLNCKFQNRTLALRLVYNDKQQISGFTVQPPFDEKPTPVQGEAVVLKTPTGDIHGSLELPKTEGPFHVVIFIAGSGPTDRDGNQAGTKNDSLRKLGTGLVKRGFATLRYDKRGIGRSNEVATNESTMSFDHFANDAIGWVKMLRADKRFKDVSILGHSQGSLVGAIAARKVKLTSLVSIAGAGLPIQDVLKMQLEPKLPPDLKTQAFEIVDKLAQGKSVPKPPQALQSLFRPSIQSFMTSWMKYDPKVEFAALKIPTLVVNGTTDIQVGVDQAKLLHEAGRQSKLVLVKDMNHVLKVCAKPEEQLKTYSDPKLPLAPTLVDEVDGFLRSVGRKLGEQ